MARQMKDSGVEWIGKIPEGWTLERAKYTFQQTNGRGNSVAELLSATQQYGMYPQSKIEGVVKVNENTDIQSFKTVHIDDYVISLRSFQGGFEHSAYEGVCSPAYQTFHAIKPVNTKYFKYFFKTPNFIDAMNALTVGIREGKNINYDDFANTVIAYPPVQEQKEISDFLDKKCSAIDDVLAKTQESIEEYKKLKQAVITEAVTKGVRGKRPMKDSGIDWIGRIPKEWNVKRFRYVADSFEKGNGITKDEVFPDGDTPCIRYGEIYTKYNQSFTDCFSRTRKERLSAVQYFTKGDILFTCTGELVEEIGKSVVYLGEEKCLAGGDIIVAKHSQDPSFLNYALNSQYAQTQKSCGKSKLKVVHISLGELKNVRLLLPSLEEQQEIADYLDKKCAAIDTLISKKQQFIEELTAYKKSLIYEYVTGKKEVPA